jgi:hypothetical protein
MTNAGGAATATTTGMTGGAITTGTTTATNG